MAYPVVGEEYSEGTEIQTVTMFKLMQAFEKVMKKLHDRLNKPQLLRVFHSSWCSSEFSRRAVESFVKNTLAIGKRSH